VGIPGEQRERALEHTGARCSLPTTHTNTLTHHPPSDPPPATQDWICGTDTWLYTQKEVKAGLRDATGKKIRKSE